MKTQDLVQLKHILKGKYKICSLLQRQAFHVESFNDPKETCQCFRDCLQGIVTALNSAVRINMSPQLHRELKMKHLLMLSW